MYVIDTIKKGLLSGDKYSDFAILYRANYISRGYEDVLVRNNIPYKIYGGLSFFSRKEIKDMIAYLRLIIHNDDDFSFRRIINEPKRKIGDATIKKLDDIKLVNNCSLFEAIDYYEGSGAAANNLVRFKTVIDEIKTKVNMLNYNTYSQTTATKYVYISRVENTILYIEVKADQKDEVMTVVEALGY